MNFSKEISLLIKEMMERFEQNPHRDPVELGIEIVKEIMEVDDQQAKAIFEEILEGIVAYRQLQSDSETLKQAEEKIGLEAMSEIEKAADEVADSILGQEEQNGNSK